MIYRVDNSSTCKLEKWKQNTKKWREEKRGSKRKAKKEKEETGPHSFLILLVSSDLFKVDPSTYLCIWTVELGPFCTSPWPNWPYAAWPQGACAVEAGGASEEGGALDTPEGKGQKLNDWEITFFSTLSKECKARINKLRPSLAQYYNFATKSIPWTCNSNYTRFWTWITRVSPLS